MNYLSTSTKPLIQRLSFLLLFLSAFVCTTAHAASPAPIVNGNTITVEADGWYQFQRASDYGEVCSGTYECTVPPGLYIVVNHSNQQRWDPVIVSGSPTEIEVEGNRIVLPDDGWYQVQHGQTYKSICEGATYCDVQPGSYIVINHTTQQRFEPVYVLAEEPVVLPAPLVPINDNATSQASFTPGSSHYWQLQGGISTTRSANVYGIDLEDNEHTGLIDQLKAQGKLVVCYISAGTYEQWRSDASSFDQNNDLGSPMGNWPGEFFLNIKSDNVRRIMRSRIDRAVAANCDALEPDNTDAYQANNGLGLTAQDQVDYLKFLADYAHSKGLQIALKNTVDLIASANLASIFDFTLNESCYTYNECNALKPFIDSNKAVYIAIYGTQSKTSQCRDAASNRFQLSFYSSDYLLDGSFYDTCN